MAQRTRRKKGLRISLPEVLGSKLRPPIAVALGSPREVAELVEDLPSNTATCYQMDLYQAERLRKELRDCDQAAEVVAAADLWDLPAEFQTVVYPAPEGGERGLKLDVIEQAFHILRPGGIFAVVSPYEKEQFFPTALKKVFGRFHAPAAGEGLVFWAQRDGERSRRRHEMTFHARVGDGPSLEFLSRPGTFCYGRFDNGARALVEIMTIEPGDQVVDLGCGAGTNGIFAAQRSGLEGQTVFVDSNLRALALAEHNARANGVAAFQVVPSNRVPRLPQHGFDVVLANPPYYAQDSIAQLFIEQGRTLLRPGGRFYLVTKRPDQIGPLVAEAFGPTEPVERRGYIVLCAGQEPTE